MSPDQVGQLLTQLGLSAVFLFMLWKLWQRHMQMTDLFVSTLIAELKIAQGVKAEGKAEGD